MFRGDTNHGLVIVNYSLTPWFVSPRNISQHAVSGKLYYAFLFALNGIEPLLKNTNIFPSNAPTPR